MHVHEINARILLLIPTAEWIENSLQTGGLSLISTQLEESYKFDQFSNKRVLAILEPVEQACWNASFRSTFSNLTKMLVPKETFFCLILDQTYTARYYHADAWRDVNLLAVMNFEREPSSEAFDRYLTELKRGIKNPAKAAWQREVSWRRTLTNGHEKGQSWDW